MRWAIPPQILPRLLELPSVSSILKELLGAQERRNGVVCASTVERITSIQEHRGQDDEAMVVGNIGIPGNGDPWG